MRGVPHTDNSSDSNSDDPSSNNKMGGSGVSVASATDPIRSKLGKAGNNVNSAAYSLQMAPISGNKSGLIAVEDGPSLIEEKEVVEKPADGEDVIDPEDNYNHELCKSICVIRDLVGCDRCGIFMYGFKHKQVKIKITKL